MLEGDLVARAEVGVEPREEDEFGKMALGKVGHSPERGRLGKNGKWRREKFSIGRMVVRRNRELRR